MLVLSPESSCDVCAESYSVESSPHSIPCGHTFCASCLSKIAQGLWSPRAHPACPLCRESFVQADIRLIRIDQAPSPGYPHVHPYPNYYPAASSSSSATKFGTVPIDEDELDDADDDQRVKREAKRLEDKVAAAAKKKCTFEEISSLQREVEQWLSKELQRRPDREHASLRLSAALLGAILVNGFAYNEAKKSAKGVEITLKDKLESAEQVKRKLEIELHKQRSQYTQKFFECQQLKQDLQRFTGGAATAAVAAPVARPLGSSLVQTVTPPRPLTAQPSRVSTPMSRSATPLASRASTPGASPHYSSYSHFPRRSASIAAAAENTSHFPIGSAADTAHLPLGSASTTTSYVYPHNPHSVSAPGSSTTSPERPSSQIYSSHGGYGSHQRWIPPASSRDEEDPEVVAARARQRPASALGSYGNVGRTARPQSTSGWRS